jgi:hypothetical protein
VGIRSYGVLQPVREAFGLSAGAVDLWRHVWSVVRMFARRLRATDESDRIELPKGMFIAH